MRQALRCINHLANPCTKRSGRDQSPHCAEEGASSEALGNLPELAPPVLADLRWEPGQSQRQLCNQPPPLPGSFAVCSVVPNFPAAPMH